MKAVEAPGADAWEARLASAMQPAPAVRTLTAMGPLSGWNAWADLSAPVIQQARRFALEWHDDQMWGDQPYIEHLDEVAALLASRGAEVWQIVAAYLHDIIEDPKCPELEILARFGCLVLHWVLMVTGFGANRKERQQDIVNKLRNDTTRAAWLKLADRVVNVRKCVREGDLRRLKMYRQEKELYAELFVAADPELALELDSLLAA